MRVQGKQCPARVAAIGEWHIHMYMYMCVYTCVFVGCTVYSSAAAV